MGTSQASVLENMPKVKYNMNTGEWIAIHCHPESKFACAGMKEGSTFVGKPISVTLSG